MPAGVTPVLAGLPGGGPVQAGGEGEKKAANGQANGATGPAAPSGLPPGAPISGIVPTPPASEASAPTVSHMLGELAWILSQSPTHKHFTLGDLEWMVMPAILLEQFRVFRGDQHPLGFALWAHFSEAAETRFKTMVEAGQGARLRPQDWKSGERLWLIELVTPWATEENKLVEVCLADLKQNVFKNLPIQMVSLTKEGARFLSI